MKWAHLPLAGGILDQNPMLMHMFRIIFAARNEYEAEQEEKRQKEQAKMRRGGSGVAGRR